MKVTDYTVDILSPRQRGSFRFMVGLWIVSLGLFWAWWLQQDHVVSLFGLFLSSLLLAWTTCLPLWYFIVVDGMKRPNRDLPLPVGDVAIVVTKAPSEPWSVVRRTLLAMLAQEFPRPYDVWLADEQPSPQTIAWCARHHVQVSSRYGVPEYQQKTWPRREKCKEGNLAYFYDTYGYERYAFVAQLDADHVPSPTYLLEMIRPFVDPSVGYVAAPSICDANATESWTVRARLFLEAGFHGPAQAGYGGRFAPMCIGSHYAVRTTALREIGGLGPELAEDHTTTLMMNAAGWRGVFAIDAIAHGDGAGSFPDSMIQEFQWSRSLVAILLGITHAHWNTLSPKLKLHFGFSQLWYLLFALHALFGSVMAPIAIMTDTPWMAIELWQFFLFFGVTNVLCTIPFVWLKRQGLLRPIDGKIFSWETALFHFVRWPWIVLALGYAIAGRLMGREFPFRVTPKGLGRAKPLPTLVLVPYLVVILLNGLTALMVATPERAGGYYYFALMDSLSYFVVILVVVGLHLRENGTNLGIDFGTFATRLAPVAGAAALLVVTSVNTRGSTAFAAVLPAIEPGLLSLASPAEPPMATIELLSGPIALPPAVVTGKSTFVRGAYDPDRALAHLPMEWEHGFVPWRPNSTDEVTELVRSIRSRGRTPVVGLEPWPFNWEGQTTETLFSDIAGGGYDATIAATCDAIGRAAPAGAIVRWGHEMDLVGHFPWSQADSQGFVNAYRHFVSNCRAAGGGNLQFLWSPAGAPNAAQYWPGESYVDYVGLTTLEFEGWSRQLGADRGLTFDELFGPRYQVVASFQKPIIIAEFGVERGTRDPASWLVDARSSFARYPLLGGFLYFNALSPVHWLDLLPDWRLDEEHAAIAFAEPGRDPSDGIGSDAPRLRPASATPSDHLGDRDQVLFSGAIID